MKFVNKFIESIKLTIGYLFAKIIDISLYFLNPVLKNKRKYITFIGRDNGKFLDNVKYAYLYFLKNKSKLDKEIIFLTEDYKTFYLLKENNLPVVKYPSIEGIKTLLLTDILVVDNLMWIKNFKNPLLKFSRKIQIWHGVGFKKIELMNDTEFNIKNHIINILSNRFPKYDIVISTSSFYTENTFKKAFKSKKIWEIGYPRNDIFFRNIDKLDLLYTDLAIIEEVKRLKKKKKVKCILYAPTFRDSGGDPITDKAINVEKLNKFLEKNKMVMILKFHPDPNFPYQKIKNASNIYIYNNSKDVYPLMKYIDCLITDYSSIYMDFLLIDRPIIFFPYDYEKYIAKDRRIQFDYNWITPGKKVKNQTDLEKEIYNTLIKNVDSYKEKRNKIKHLAFKYIDGKAAERLFQGVKKLLGD